MSVLNMTSVLTGTTGTGAITCGAAASASFVTEVQASAVDQKPYHFHVQENADFMLCAGVYTSSGRSLSIGKVLLSSIGGTVGTTQMTLAGAAVVTFVSLAEDFQELTAVRDTTGTSDAIVNADGGGIVTYNNASAIAVTIAQATGLNFKKGWFTFLKNKGAGLVTITPTTSTIDNNKLAAGQSMLLYSDGTNYFSILFRNDATTIGNLLFTAASAAAARATLGSTTVGDALFTAVSVDAAQQTLTLAAMMRGHLAGLTLSTAGGSGTFGVAVGVATDSTNADFISLLSAFTKTTAAWAVGTGNGSFDGTGSAPSATSGWYHVYLIKRPDTGVVDVLTSNSATSPTLPTNYTLFRRIGAMLTDGSFHWLLFHQLGDEFLWDTRIANLAGSASNSSATLQTLTVPFGIQINALGVVEVVSTSGGVAVLVSPPDEVDQAATTQFQTISAAGTGQIGSTEYNIRTNTSSQIRLRSSSSSVGNVYLTTRGWIDTRGKYL